MSFKVERVVFLSLLLDLFAFTIPLPLFPRIIEWYTIVSGRIVAGVEDVLNNTQRESAYPDGFLARTLRLVSETRNLLLRTPGKNPQKWDIVLLGEPKAKAKCSISQRFIQEGSWGQYSRQFRPFDLTRGQSDVATAPYSSSSHPTLAHCPISMAGNVSSSSLCWATYSLP